jgi:hypothetical protein
MTATVRQHPAGCRYARLPADGFAVDPDLADPTGVLAVTFGDLASPLIVAVRVAGAEHLDTVARLALIEIQHRSAAPMFAPSTLRLSPAW